MMTLRRQLPVIFVAWVSLDLPACATREESLIHDLQAVPPAADPVQALADPNAGVQCLAAEVCGEIMQSTPGVRALARVPWDSACADAAHEMNTEMLQQQSTGQKTKGRRAPPTGLSETGGPMVMIACPLDTTITVDDIVVEHLKRENMNQPLFVTPGRHRIRAQTLTGQSFELSGNFLVNDIKALDCQ